MPQLQLANPLEWPSFMPVTERFSRLNASQFQSDLQDHQALAFLQDEVDRTPGVFSGILFSDALNINSAAPTQYLSKNPGVTLRLTINGEQFFLCCDRWLKMAHNLYALHLALRYFRQLEEWGVGTLPLLLSGFSSHQAARAGGAQAGADGSMKPDQWRIILGLGPTATLDDANAIYRSRAKALGERDPDGLQELNLAIQQARHYFGAA